MGLSLVALTGCVAPPVPLPPGITTAIYQQRPDYAPRGLQITVVNGADAPLTITRATYLSGRFAGTTEWVRPVVVAAGARVDLRVLLGDPVCDGDISGEVELGFTTADGGDGTAILVPDDEFDTLARVTAEDCLTQAAAAITSITVGDTVRTEVRAGRLVGLVDVTAVPTGAEGTATISQVGRTILLRPATDGATGWPLDWRVDAATGALTATLDFEPSNCNPHIVAEDKRGTFFPFAVTLDDGLSGTVFAGVDDEVRGSIYSYIEQYCGW